MASLQEGTTIAGNEAYHTANLPKFSPGINKVQRVCPSSASGEIIYLIDGKLYGSVVGGSSYGRVLLRASDMGIVRNDVDILTDFFEIPIQGKYNYLGYGKFTELEVVGNTAYALSDDHRLYGWGGAGAGVLGGGNTDYVIFPLPLQVDIGVDKFFTRKEHTSTGLSNFAIHYRDTDGNIKTLGNGVYGCTGLGNTDMVDNPEIITDVPKWSEVYPISDTMVFAVTPDNRILAWGKNTKRSSGSSDFGDPDGNGEIITTPTDVTDNWNPDGWEVLDIGGTGDIYDTDAGEVVAYDTAYIVLKNPAGGFKVMGCGSGADSKLGTDTNDDTATPVVITEVDSGDSGPYFYKLIVESARGPVRVTHGPTEGDFQEGVNKYALKMKMWGYNGNGVLGIGNSDPGTQVYTRYYVYDVHTTYQNIPKPTSNIRSWITTINWAGKYFMVSATGYGGDGGLGTGYTFSRDTYSTATRLTKFKEKAGLQLPDLEKVHSLRIGDSETLTIYQHSEGISICGGSTTKYIRLKNPSRPMIPIELNFTKTKGVI